MTTATTVNAAGTATAQPAGPTGPGAPVRAPAPGPRGTRPAKAAAAHGPVLPALATVLLVCVPAYREPGGGGAGPTLADAASGVLVVCCAAWALRTRARPLDATAAAVLAAPAAGLALAAVTAQDPVAGLTGYVRLLQVFVLVPAALVLALRSPRHARPVAASLVAVAVVQGAVGVHQYLTGTGASYRGESVRAVGTFGPADVMGMASAVSCGVVVALAAGLAPPAGAPRWLRPAALGTAAALLVPLVLSFSRGAWISTAAACTVVLLLTGLRTALCALAAASAAAVVLVGGFGVGGDLVAERAASITEVAAEPDQSVTDRYTMWAAAVEIWHENPLTGVGPKGFAEHRDSHASLALSSASDTAGAGQDFHRQPLLSPHNMYLLLLAEHGLAGAVAVTGGWAALLVLGVRRLRLARAAGRDADCGLAATGLLVLVCVDFLYADIGGPSTVLTAVALGLAAWWALAPAAAAGGAATGRARGAKEAGAR
ncbi:O-antigen ligase family protein [Streptomyces verrucosisporus]|uniref:O-antigen ligase family protein n=1 Tax=Streptomyces verrucosisporus TaxID=1695161 RepID=UPI0035588DA1